MRPGGWHRALVTEGTRVPRPQTIYEEAPAARGLDLRGSSSCVSSSARRVCCGEAPPRGPGRPGSAVPEGDAGRRADTTAPSEGRPAEVSGRSRLLVATAAQRTATSWPVEASRRAAGRWAVFSGPDPGRSSPQRADGDGGAAEGDTALAPPRVAHPPGAALALWPGSERKCAASFRPAPHETGRGIGRGRARADGRLPGPMGTAAAAGLPDAPLSGPLTPPGRTSRTGGRTSEVQVCGDGGMAGWLRAAGGRADGLPAESGTGGARPPRPYVSRTGRTGSRAPRRPRAERRAPCPVPSHTPTVQSF